MHFPPSNVLLPRLTEPRTLLSTMEEARIAATTVASSAQRVLTILTHSLESEIYEYPPFIAAVKRFVLNPARIMYGRHEFIAIARKLTSYIEIRNAQGEYRDHPSTYMIADDRATLYRLQSHRWDGLCELRNEAVARLYLEHFDIGWTQCAVPRAQALSN
jgi:hypothetical protein